MTQIEVLPVIVGKYPIALGTHASKCVLTVPEAEHLLFELQTAIWEAQNRQEEGDNHERT